jgi:hypothetical protein
MRQKCIVPDLFFLSTTRPDRCEAPGSSLVRGGSAKTLLPNVLSRSRREGRTVPTASTAAPLCGCCGVAVVAGVELPVQLPQLPQVPALQPDTPRLATGACQAAAGPNLRFSVCRQAPTARWGVTGADGKQAGSSGTRQVPARQPDTPRLATGACQAANTGGLFRPNSRNCRTPLRVLRRCGSCGS